MEGLEIEAKELAARLARGERIYLVDVRQQWEHEIAALPGSVLLPLGELTRRWEELEPPPGALTVVYCHHGVRSLSATAWLQRQGMPNVLSLAGGIDAWSAEIDPAVPRY